MLYLPEKEADLLAVVDLMIRAGLEVRNIQAVEWLYNHYYMLGARRFSTGDYTTGSLKAHFEDISGEIQYRFEKIVAQYRDEVGRRLRVDMMPKVDRTLNFSLDGLQKSSMAQATLSTLVADVDLEMVKLRGNEMLLMYGTVGIASWGQSSPRLERAQAVIEIVPPWELLPVPANPNSPGEVKGIIRYRPVPYEWIKSKEGLKFPDKSKLRLRQVQFGDAANSIDAVFSDSNIPGTTASMLPQPQGDGSVGGDKKKQPDTNKVVTEYGDLAEIFVENPDGTLAEYIVWFAGAILRRSKFKDVKEPPMMPVGIARDIEVGGFYGRSTVSLLRPTNMEVEYLMKQLFENASDLDQFGILMLPTTMGIRSDQLKRTGKPRFCYYEPDITVPEHKPFAIQPVNTGDWPGKVAQMGVQMMDSIAGQSPIYQGQAPGRVDSAAGLGFLHEAGSISLGGPMILLANAFVTCYRALLGMARETWMGDQLARITLTDDALAGIVVDPATGKVAMDKNSIPHPREVVIQVASQSPVSKEQRKQELMGLLKMGVINQTIFRRVNFMESLGFPIPVDAEYQAYRKAMLNNIIMFGDGKTPAKVLMSQEQDLPAIHLEVLQTFMARPEFMLASEQVKNAFVQAKQYRMQQMGQYPVQMPPPEDAAAMQQQMMQGQPQMPDAGM